MTENDVKIKKALECCIEIPEKCSQCPNKELRFKGIHCKQRTYKDAYDLINRYESEIKRLNRLCKFRKSLIDGLKKMLKRSEEIKIEAYKDCVVKLKEEIRSTQFAYEADKQCEYLDDFLNKNLVGES